MTIHLVKSLVSLFCMIWSVYASSFVYYLIYVNCQKWWIKINILVVVLAIVFRSTVNNRAEWSLATTTLLSIVLPVGRFVVVTVTCSRCLASVNDWWVANASMILPFDAWIEWCHYDVIDVTWSCRSNKNRDVINLSALALQNCCCRCTWSRQGRRD